LFQNAVQCAWRYIITRMPCYRDSSWFLPMLILTMTSLCDNQIPPIGFNAPNDITYFHRCLPFWLFTPFSSYVANIPIMGSARLVVIE